MVFLRTQTPLFDGTPRALLHIAPEPALRPHFAAAAGPGYRAADQRPGTGVEALDVTDIGYPSATFDVIYCSHVLEHVPEDRRALGELRRVLKPGGFAILNVPITAAATIEDLSVTDPEERLRRYGQRDHVRRYGPDYTDRLAQAGFVVRRVLPGDLLDPAEVRQLGLAGSGAGALYYCTPR